MKIEEYTQSDCYGEWREYKVSLTFDDPSNPSYYFEVNEDIAAPEDNTLGRSFSDCFMLPDMLEAAHAAGARGEPLEVQ